MTSYYFVCTSKCELNQTSIDQECDKIVLKSGGSRMSEARCKTIHTAQSILNTLNNHQADLRRMRVRRLGLFGSYRRGTPTPESDIDFLVVLERPSFDAYMDLKFFLEDLFGCPVDLVLEETIKPRLRSYILGEVVYAQGL
jgi:uncharacterized protein